MDWNEALKKASLSSRESEWIRTSSDPLALQIRQAIGKGIRTDTPGDFPSLIAKMKRNIRRIFPVEEREEEKEVEIKKAKKRSDREGSIYDQGGFGF